MEYTECKTMNPFRGSIYIEGKHLIIFNFSWVLDPNFIITV